MPAAPGNAPTERMAAILLEMDELVAICEWFYAQAPTDLLTSAPPMPGLLAYHLEKQRIHLTRNKTSRSRARMAHLRERNRVLTQAELEDIARREFEEK